MDSLKSSLRKAIQRNLDNKVVTKEGELTDGTENPDNLFEKEFKKVNLGISEKSLSDVPNESPKCFQSVSQCWLRWGEQF